MIKEATLRDAEIIACLVNKAYRPEPGARGWTHEADLVSGQRTDSKQVARLISEYGSVLLAYEDDVLLGCVHVEQAMPHCNIGMLAIVPTRQNKGVGSQLLMAAENLAVSRYGAHGFKIAVLSDRPELLAYYQRRGYRHTGSTYPYPIDAGIGHPFNAGLQVLELVKLCLGRD